MKSIIVAVGFSGLLIAAAHAQSNPKREACLKEAEAKGLYTTGGRNPGRFNESTAPQRQEFMKECMGRK
jgi:hypothetical protein